MEHVSFVIVFQDNGMNHAIANVRDALHDDFEFVKDFVRVSVEWGD